MFLTNYLKNNNLQTFDDVKSELTSEKFKLKVKEDYLHPTLYLVVYDKNKSVMNEELVRECRGIILEKESNRVVCHTFPKSEEKKDLFQNGFNESDVVIERAIDGTQIRLFYYNGVWNCATTRCISAIHSKFYGTKTFLELFLESSVNFDYNELNKEYCYSFVLCHPYNRIVVPYSHPTLYHVGTRNLISPTLEELFDHDIKIQRPPKINFKSYDEMEKYMKDEKTYAYEGVIIRKGKLRYKMRTVLYNFIRELRGNNTNQLYDYFRLLTQNKVDLFLQYYPELTALYNAFGRNNALMTNRIHQEYMDKNIHHTLTYQQMTWHFKPTIYNLHKLYITNRQRITKQVVREYLLNLDPAQLCFIYNKEMART